MISQGIYEHYKSTPDERKCYQVLFLSRFEETREIMVHYVPLYFLEDGIYNDGITIWTRTLKNFSQLVTHNGKRVLRFKLIQKTVVQ